jgi:hypothetical protein
MRQTGLSQVRGLAAVAGLALLALLLIPATSRAAVQWGLMRFEPTYTKTLSVPYGSAARVSGTISICGDQSAYRTASMGEYMRVGPNNHVLTDSQIYTLPYPGECPNGGNPVGVAFDVPPGPSRQLQFGFGGWGPTGSGYIGNYESILELTVTYRLVLYPSARRVGNGERVRFTGVMPAFFDAGKPALLLQVRLGKKWRTFKTIQVASDGTYSGVYRFTNTRRKQLYKFRVKPGGAYFPIALSPSAKARVKVVP